MTGDELYFLDDLLGEFVSNLQNKPTKFFDRNESTIFKDEQEFNKFISGISNQNTAKKTVDRFVKEWFMNSMENMIKSWMKTGVRTITGIKFKVY